MQITPYRSSFLRVLPFLILCCLCGCAKLPEQKGAWPWEYGRGQGEPNLPNYFSVRTGVANFDKPPAAVKPITPESIAPPAPAEQPVIVPAPAVKPEISAAKSVAADMLVAAPDREYDFMVEANIPLASVVQTLDINAPGKVLTAINKGRAPVSVVIAALQDASTDRALPYYAVVPANSNNTLLKLVPRKGGEPRGFHFRYNWIIGDFTARHHCTEPYLYPFDKKIRAYAQVNDEKNSTPYNRYAVIFSVAKRTAVLAARKGIVVRLHSNSKIDILHDDATIGTYSHLGSIAHDMVPGKTVTTDDVIGIAGTAEDNRAAYLQLTVWRPVPRDNSALLRSTQQADFNAVSFPLPFSALASEKGHVLVKDQVVSRAQLPAFNRRSKKSSKPSHL